ncbi:uncharacterized protein LOC143540176 [Bidens hawaiensis]|uniref:uncharacterized protein LOC143540176 n=1 Tax=Bidens hawaiensis TaxID=980011 RepID=UPI0040497805
MWRAFPEVLMIDTTYNTNMYDWPLVQFISVTSTSKSFCIATTFVIRERQRNFTWALEKLKQMLDDCMEPGVILTDADQALMNACDAVFPNATKNLCRWHISENIRRKFKGLYRTDMGTDFAYWWKVLYQSPTIQDYDNRCINIVNDTCIPIKDVDPFWRRLNFDPAYPPNEEPDYEAGMCEINDTLSFIDDPNQKKSFFVKLISAILGRSKKKSPEKREDPRGRPKKPDPPRHSSYTPAPDLPRHSSYTPFLSQVPSNETPTPSSLSRSLSQSASRFSIRRGRTKTSKPTGAHLGFPLMVSPAQVPAIEMFRTVIPGWAHPFVADIKNERPDGNCGFRSIAVGLEIHEKLWPDIRRAMQNKLETNEGWWRAMFSKEDERLYGWVHSSIPYSNTVKPVSPSRWFSLPGHGHVAAQTYACVLVNLAGN